MIAQDFLDILMTLLREKKSFSKLLQKSRDRRKEREIYPNSAPKCPSK